MLIVYGIQKERMDVDAFEQVQKRATKLILDL